MSSKILRDSTAEALAAAIEGNLFEFFKVINQSWAGSELHDEANILWAISSVPSPLFNSVLWANFDPVTAGDVIEAVKAHYRDRRVPWSWQVGPASSPENLGELLEAHGLHYYEDTPGLALDLEDLPADFQWPVGLTILRVEDPGRMQDWVRILARAFHLPKFASEAMLASFVEVGFHWTGPIIHYLGLADGEPVACSSLFTGSGVAGIYNVATLPTARGRGFGAALTLAPLLQARSRGFKFGALQSSREGISIYSRLGFKTYCSLGQYIGPG